MLKRLIRSQHVNSDFLSFIAAHPDKDVVFFDVGCRGEPIEKWPTRRKGLFYIGVDADNVEVAKLKHLLLNYHGFINASFVNAIVTSDGLPKNFARSDVGMTDRLIEDAEVNIYAENGWRVSVESSEKLDVIVDNVIKQLSLNNPLFVLKIDVEGYAHDVMAGQVSLSRFDFVMCEFLPDMPMQFSAMALLERSGFEVVDIERAYKYDPEHGRKLFIIDTIWRAKLKNVHCNASQITPGVLKKVFSFTVFYIVRILMRLLNKKTYISISDSEIRW